MVNRNERHVHLSHQFLSMYFLGQSIKASREEKNQQIGRFGVYLQSQKKSHYTVLNCSSYFFQEVVHTPFVPVLQPAFQPSSTPTHLMHRFMVCTTLKVTKP